MKQLLLASAFISTLCLLSCGEDDADGVYTGSWVADEVAVEDCQEAARNSRETVSCEEEETCFRLTLNGDGSYTFKQRFFEERGTWSRDGRQLSLCLEDEGEISCDEYLAVLTNESLVVTSDSTSSGCVTVYNFNKESVTDTTSAN